ncbi:MAG TPA: hypothetical protein VGK33_03320 [Chloroflexota bacterium]
MKSTTPFTAKPLKSPRVSRPAGFLPDPASFAGCMVSIWLTGAPAIQDRAEIVNVAFNGAYGLIANRRGARAGKLDEAG